MLDRRRGIPITLSILYLEIGTRLGLELEGISFPGHFLVKYPTEEGDLVLDPFSGGMPLDEKDLRTLLDRTYREPNDAPPLEQLLTSAGKKEILVRMLRNLKGAYLRREQFDKALSVVDQIEPPEEIVPIMDHALATV